MKKTTTTAVRQLNVEIPVRLHAAVKALADRQGRKLKALVAEALQQLLAR
jgi:predicted HicB family RNase H-like nuclease